VSTLARIRTRLNAVDREYFAIGWTLLMLGAIGQINGALPVVLP
jgi:hypothetical protein